MKHANGKGKNMNAITKSYGESVRRNGVRRMLERFTGRKTAKLKKCLIIC